MGKSISLLSLCWMLLFASEIKSQQTYQCVVYDKVVNKPIQGATIILIQKSNRKMLGFSRTNGFGRAQISADTLKDSVLLWVLHKRFVEYSCIINFSQGKRQDTIDMIPQNKVLKEVIVSGNRAVTMSGDTVSYVADSFKLPAGASVEDLLKKLPGIQVAKDGTIKAQGKKVDKVLVDGDDFFGDDASVATKNLDASMIDKVEVIDAATKKSESTGSEEDKLKVINLKLKKEAKKGFFGKLEEGYSNTNRYNSSNMVNVFQGNTKLAGFLIADNLRSRMSWQDMQDMGIEQNWTYDEDLDLWISKDGENSSGNTFQVIPDNLKSGTLFSQKFNDGSGAIKAKYNYNQSKFNGSQSSNGTTYYSDFKQQYSSENFVNSTLSKHSAGVMLEKRFDTLNKLIINVSGNVGGYEGSTNTQNLIYRDSILINSSSKENPFSNTSQSFSFDSEYERKFSKKGRFLGLKFDYKYGVNNADRWNRMNGWIYKTTDSTLQSQDQKNVKNSRSSTLKLSTTFMEPLFVKGMFAELGLSMVDAKYKSLLNTYSYNSMTAEYTDRLALLSNNYEFSTSGFSESIKLNYKSKKIDWFVGTKFHQVLLNQRNMDSSSLSLYRHFNYILPMMNFIWKYKRNSQLSIGVSKSVKPPTIDQIQPWVDNSNPQYIQIGNPNLNPSEQYNFKISNSFWYPVSQTNLWSSFTYRLLQNDIVDSVITMSDGITREYSTQVNGNSSMNANLWYSFRLPKLGLECNPGLWMSLDNRNRYLNGTKVKTSTLWSSFSLQFSKSIDSLLQSGLEFSLNWNQINSDNALLTKTNNFTWEISTSHEIQLPWKFKVKGELEYRILPSNAAFNDNQTFTLLNAYLEKSFLKDNSLITRVTVYDVLGQNRSISRNFYQNSKTESINQALTRYFMLTMIYKFKNKRKQTNNEPEF